MGAAQNAVRKQRAVTRGQLYIESEEKRRDSVKAKLDGGIFVGFEWIDRFFFVGRVRELCGFLLLL